MNKNMTMGLTKRKFFGRKLKVILAKHDIRQNDLAQKLGVGRSYINQVCSGMTVFNGKKNSIIYDFLLNLGVSEQDLHDYSRLYIEARGNFDLNTISLSNIERNPLKSMIIEDMELFTEENLKKFRRCQERLLKDQRVGPVKQNLQ
ncbi:MAG: helix-turn-helix transcriptional regulator [Victivallaceae bacterium]|nr:helix-turn-helix transcriptional regulator [Victivallaceae bacterium]